MTAPISRRRFVGRGALGAAGLAAGVAGTAWAEGGAGGPGDVASPRAGSADFEVRVQPARVFRRTADFNRERLEHVHAVLVLVSPTQREATVDSLVVSSLARGEVRQATQLPRAALTAMNLLPPNAASANPNGPFPHLAVQLRNVHPASLAIDVVRCEFVVEAAGGRHEVRHDIAIETFEQRTALVFPFRGRGLITQGGIANDGHRNRSGLFAVDALALGERYAMMATDGDRSEDVAGWGREVISPGAGTIVVATGDRPDQPVLGNSDAQYYAPAFPQGGDPGNHVVIDHGNGEFSMIAHFQRDSLRVRVGDRVTQGQPLGKLGSSGDSSSPHVHHQLQTGSDWQRADGLPHHYENGPGRRHDRGWIFNAR